MSNPINQYPFEGHAPVVTRLPLRRWAANEIAAYRKRKAERDAPEVPVLVVPPVQTDEERGEGDSTNSRLHRILRGKQ